MTNILLYILSLLFACPTPNTHPSYSRDHLPDFIHSLMPNQTFLIRAHARTIYTHPVTFVCAECHSTTTREIYPGKMPTYCLSCRPRRKKSAQVESSKGMFHPTHRLIAADGRKTEVCLEKSSNPGWSWVRTALDWFSGSSIIQYHPDKGIISHETPLSGYTLIPFQEEQKPQGKSSSSKSKTKSKAKKTSTQVKAEQPKNLGLA